MADENHFTFLLATFKSKYLFSNSTLLYENCFSKFQKNFNDIPKIQKDKQFNFKIKSKIFFYSVKENNNE